MADYKVSPELKRPAQAKWLSDDYVKFIRMAEHVIERNGEGILSFVTNHSYLDNPTFLDMRQHLRRNFDRIFVLDLHGNSKKKEVSPDGSPDKNVFDIQQGVAIILAVRRRRASGKLDDLAPVYHSEFWGSRKSKSEQLWKSSPSSLSPSEVSPRHSPWRFVPTDHAAEQHYREGFSAAHLFSVNGRPAPGIVTTQDEFAISFSKSDAIAKVHRLLSTDSEIEARQLFRLCSQSQWNYQAAKLELPTIDWLSLHTPLLYRPFDNRHTIYSHHVAVHRRDRAMAHFFNKRNLGLMIARQAIQGNAGYSQVVAVERMIDNRAIFSSKGVAQLLPLYLYPEEDNLDQSVRLNLDPKLYAKICEAAGIDPADQAGPDDDFRAPRGDARPSEVKVFDYIYGVLHSPDYRKIFAEFLKIDFPRIPYPASPEVFAHVSGKGEALRRLHLMEPAAIGETAYPFMGEVEEGEDDSTVASGYPKHKDGHVWINRHQYFRDVPATAWEFYIGGYQPAQKWLKDRKGRVLSWDDIGHYQNIVKILLETDRIMQQITLPLDS